MVGGCGGELPVREGGNGASRAEAAIMAHVWAPRELQSPKSRDLNVQKVGYS